MSKRMQPNTSATKPAAPKAAAAKPKPAPAQSATETEIPAASGAEAKVEGPAVPEAGADAKASEATGADAADPAGTDTATAAASEDTREQADAASTDRKDAAEAGNEPEVAAWPPVAVDFDHFALVVTGPANGRRRAGFAFGREAVELAPADLIEGTASPQEYGERLLSLLEDPALRCRARLPDGSEREISPEEVEELRQGIAAHQAEAGPSA